MAEIFKDWLLRLIEERNLTYAALGKLIGVSHSSISQWSSGKYNPDPLVLIKLAEVTGENPQRLFNMVYGLPMPDSEADTSEQIERIMRKAEALPESVQEQLEAYIDFLLARGRKQNVETNKEKADAAHRK